MTFPQACSPLCSCLPLVGCKTHNTSMAPASRQSTASPLQQGVIGSPKSGKPNWARARKEPQSQKTAGTAPKNCLNSSRALPNKTRVLRQIVPENSPRNFGKIFVTQVLWGTFSVPEWGSRIGGGIIPNPEMMKSYDT